MSRLQASLVFLILNGAAKTKMAFLYCREFVKNYITCPNFPKIHETEKIGAPALADPRGAPGTRPPPHGGPNSFICKQFLAKKLKNKNAFQ